MAMKRFRKKLHMRMLYEGTPVWRIWRALTVPLCDSYRPEEHYMRGSGPKHRAKASNVTPKTPDASINTDVNDKPNGE
jgi:hypothetical protein